MPSLKVESVGTFEIPDGKKLVLALVDECKIDQLHACGGFARCTTCRVDILAGEPGPMTAPEKDVLTQRGLIDQPGARLSCQIMCNEDLTVRVVNRLAGSGRANAGNRPADALTP